MQSTEAVMAQVIEIYVPAKFQKIEKWARWHSEARSWSFRR